MLLADRGPTASILAGSLILSLFLVSPIQAQQFGDQNVITTDSDFAVSVYAADLTGDDVPDVISASAQDNKVAWYENEGGGSFSGQNVITTSADQAESVFAKDLTGDGTPDVLSASTQDNKIAWYENQGGGNFSGQKVITTDATAASSVFARDLDGDGDADVLAAFDNKVAWYENETEGGFAEQSIITADAEAARSVFAQDLNGDGNADILSASGPLSNSKVAWYENEEGETFSGQKVIATNAFTPFSVHAEDLDADGDADVLSASAQDDKVAWYENEGDGPDEPISVSIEGTRIPSAVAQTLPSLKNTPEDAVPYPPNETRFHDRVEAARYPADRVSVRARVRLSDSFDGSVEDIDVEGTLDGQTMQTVIRDSVDTDGDGKIDALPFDHYNTGDGTEYADVLLVSSQDIENGAENLSLDVTATTASSDQSEASENVSLYYAEHGEDARPFDPQTDGYRFENLTMLSFKEITTLLLGSVGGGYLAWYQELRSWNGRCFGMAGTAGVYFEHPEKKVFSGETYQQPESDTETRQQIADYQIAQDLTDIGSRLDTPDLPTEYDMAKEILKEQTSPPMIAWEWEGGGRHAVLATKLTVLQDKGEAVFEVHNSNLPGTTHDLSYNLQANELNGALQTQTVTSFVALNVDDVPFFPGASWLRSIIADLVDSTGKVFAAAFSSSGNNQTNSPATAENKEWETTYVLVENEQGERAGHLPDGTEVNEIDGAIVKEVVTDSAAGEKASYVAVPPEGTYTSTIETSAAGDVRFEHAVPNGDATPVVNSADGISFEQSSVAKFDESDENKEVKLDKDGDGTVDETISTESSVLPVELAGFSARLEGSSTAMLIWQTASEDNNAGFEVQRKGASEPDAAWSKIGFVESKASGGTSNEPLSYRFEDEDLPFSPDRLEYRLRQVDLDGTTELLGPVVIEQSADRLELQRAFPNPAREQATIRFAVPERQEVSLRLYDTLGRQVRTVTQGHMEGHQEMEVDLSMLPSGTYFLRLSAEGRVKTRQLTVVR